MQTMTADGVTITDVDLQLQLHMHAGQSIASSSQSSLRYLQSVWVMVRNACKANCQAQESPQDQIAQRPCKAWGCSTGARPGDVHCLSSGSRALVGADSAAGNW